MLHSVVLVVHEFPAHGLNHWLSAIRCRLSIGDKPVQCVVVGIHLVERFLHHEAFQSDALEIALLRCKGFSRDIS